MMPRRTAIVGGGIAGITAAWQLARLGEPFALYEASPRLGGTVRTVHRDGFVVELGPDGWVSEKPWAAELARELGLGGDLIGSKNAGRVTWILQAGELVAVPDGMRMMVPTDLRALEGSRLFSDEARAAYAREAERGEELRAGAPEEDESIASFVLRHFGNEVLYKVAAPLLSGVFGGDVWELSVRAVMPRFVEMERRHGSLVKVLAGSDGRPGGQSIFTTLRDGVGSLLDRMIAELPAEAVQTSTPVLGVIADGGPWIVVLPGGRFESFDEVILATPAHVTRELLPLGRASCDVAPAAAELLPVEASSAILVALAFDGPVAVPPGFGFLVPHGEETQLLAGTFVEGKFAGRVPEGNSLLRAFFGGAQALALLSQDDDVLASLALGELRKVLPGLPEPRFSLVQRWPLSLPQYRVGHVERIAMLEAQLPKGLHLLGNAYHGLGLPDVIRGARAAASKIAEG